MQKQLKEVHPGHSGPFALRKGPSPSPELEVDRTDKALALRAFTQRQTACFDDQKAAQAGWSEDQHNDFL